MFKSSEKVVWIVGENIDKQVLKMYKKNVDPITKISDKLINAIKKKIVFLDMQFSLK